MRIHFLLALVFGIVVQFSPLVWAEYAVVFDPSQLDEASLENVLSGNGSRFGIEFLLGLGIGLVSDINETDITELKSMKAVMGVYRDQKVFVAVDDDLEYSMLAQNGTLPLQSYDTFRAATEPYPQRRLKKTMTSSTERSPQNRTIESQSNAPDHLTRLTTHLKWDLITDRSYYYDATGSSVTVYVLDNGIAEEHPEFEERVFFGADYSGSMAHGPMMNHGTHVAGLIGSKTYGVAKKAEMVDVRVADSFGVSTVSQVLRGLNFVLWDMLVNGLVGSPVVINISLATKTKSPEEIKPLTHAVEQLNKIPGIVVVTALGNLKSSIEYIGPAGLQNVVVVGSSDVHKDLIATFTNHMTLSSSDYYIFAPGVNVSSVSFQSDSIPAVMSGSSASAALASGCALLYLEKGAPSTDIGIVLVAKSTKKLLNPLDQLSQFRFRDTPNRLLYCAPLSMDHRSI